MTEDDLANHTVDWCGTLAQPFAGSVVHEIPPNGQGIGALMALGMLEALGIGGQAVDHVDTVHCAIETMKLALADLYHYNADPAAMRVAPSVLLDPGYLAERARLIDPQRAGDPGDVERDSDGQKQGNPLGRRTRSGRTRLEARIRRQAAGGCGPFSATRVLTSAVADRLLPIFAASHGANSRMVSANFHGGLITTMPEPTSMRG